MPSVSNGSIGGGGGAGGVFADSNSRPHSDVYVAQPDPKKSEQSALYSFL